MEYGICEKYGKKSFFLRFVSVFKTRKGFVAIGMSKVLAKELSRMVI